MRVFLLVKFLMLFAACFAEDSSEEDNNPLNNNKALLKFIELVDKYQLNVTVIGVHVTDDGENKETTTLAATMPVEDPAFQNNITKEDLQQFIDAAKQEKLEASARQFKGNKIVTDLSHLEDLTIIKEYQLLTEVNDGKKGFHQNDTYLITQKNYLVVGDDGKNETVRVLYTQYPVELVRKSKNMNATVIDFVKKTLPLIEMLYVDNTLKARSLVEALDGKFPERNWQCIYNPGFYHFDTKHWAIFKYFHKVIIFSYEK